MSGNAVGEEEGCWKLAQQPVVIPPSLAREVGLVGWLCQAVVAGKARRRGGEEARKTGGLLLWGEKSGRRGLGL